MRVQCFAGQGWRFSLLLTETFALENGEKRKKGKRVDEDDKKKKPLLRLFFFGKEREF